MDIVGLKVCLKEKDNVIGEVIGFYNFGAGDIIEIKISGQKATEMLPFTKAYVPTINHISGNSPGLFGIFANRKSIKRRPGAA